MTAMVVRGNFESLGPVLRAGYYNSDSRNTKLSRFRTQNWVGGHPSIVLISTPAYSRVVYLNFRNILQTTTRSIVTTFAGSQLSDQNRRHPASIYIVLIPPP